MPLFKDRPTWAARGASSASPSHNGSGMNLFDKSRGAQAQLDREQEELRKIKEEQKKQKEREQRDQDRPIKKRRVSNEVGETEVPDHIEVSFEEIRNNETPSPKKPTVHNHRNPVDVESRRKVAVIDLEDGPVRPRTRANKAPISPTIEDDSEDDDVKEQIKRLAAQARARQEREKRVAAQLVETPQSPERKQQHQPNGATSATNVASQQTASLVPEATKSFTPDVPSQASDENEAFASILVHSRMQDTVPLIVKRGLKHSLREVRKAWCGRQAFSDEVAKSISLYWRGHRVFDSATCSSLGIEATSDGDLCIKTPKGKQIFNEGRIAMEAKTKEMHEEDLRNAAAGNSTAASNANPASAPGTEGEAPKPQGIRVILRALGFDDYKVIVKSVTLASKITSVFAKARSVPPDKEVYIVFEGDRIDGSTTVEQLELQDWDVLELTVK